MYRLNASQQQQQQQQQQQPQQTGQHKQSTIPSHILLQQQLAAAAAAAAATGNNNSTNNNNNNNAAAALTFQVANANGGAAAATTAIATITTANSVEDKLKLLTTATATSASASSSPATIKTEPMPDVIASSSSSNTANANAATANVSNNNGSSSSSAAAAAAAAASTSAAAAAAATAAAAAATSNGHLVFVPTKRARLDAPEDWMSTPSPGSVPSSAPPLSPSPGSQNHSFNGYASPMSAGSYDPYSPNGKPGRDDLSPSSSLNGYSVNEGCDAKKSKKGPAPRLQEELCLVCGDRASGYHYNALTCEGCKGFFRRSVTKNAVYCCKFGRACEMDMYMRRKCQECRLKKCLAVGMRPECVVPENQCAMKRREKKAQKEKDKVSSSPSSQHGLNSSIVVGQTGAGNGPHGTHDYVKKEILDLMTCEPPQHPTIPLLPDDILAECQARKIPPLTFNQLAVIYKLIWYQDGYEQPSEEDLKRIMSQPDENESQTDVSFRHITEITILTVQLIVEFAKGLPAFTKIPQEDQITLLKACSSEVMMLRMARRYDHNSDSIFFANNQSYTRDSYKMAGMADNIEDLLHFCRQMFSMKVDNVEYALLTAIVIFSDRPGLEKAQLVEAIQSYYIDTLRIYILNRHCGDSMSLVFFAKLLSILTELRTLGNQNAEMCFSLKLKNRKLPKFLEEIWDVHAIPPSLQSHLQAQQEEQERLARAERMRGVITAGLDADSASTSSQAALAAAAQHQQQHQQQQHQQHHSLSVATHASNPTSSSSISGSGISVSAVSTSSDYINAGGGGAMGPTTAAASSSTSITAAVPSSSTTSGVGGVSGASVVSNGGGNTANNVNMYANAQTAMALMGVPLKSEHSTTTA